MNVRSSLDPRIGTVIQGRYRILSVLGVGGMGTVYLAEQLSIGRRVAVKILQPQFADDEDFVNRFRREAQQAAAVTDPRVVAIYEFGRTEEGGLFLVMEYVAGQSLKDVIQEGPLPLERALLLAAELGDALAAVHRAGIIHRDVKPENVVVREGTRTELKLMDFGIARPSEMTGRTRHTRTGLIVGTPEYIAPEQVSGAEVSARTDLYAWGIVVYELLSGEVPFQAPTPALLLVKHLQEQPVPVRRLRREVPAVVERLVMECLAKEPAERPRDMMEAVGRLRSVLAGAEGQTPGTVVTARPVVENNPSSGTGLKVALGATAVMALLAIGAAAVFGVRWQEAQARLSRTEVNSSENAEQRGALSAELEAQKAKIAELDSTIAAQKAKIAESDSSIEAQKRVLARIENGKFKVCNRETRPVEIKWLAATYRSSDDELKTFNSAYHRYKTWSIPAGESRYLDFAQGNTSIWRGDVVVYAIELSYRDNDYNLAGAWSDVEDGCLQLRFAD